MEAIKGNDMTQDDYTLILMEITDLQLEEDLFDKDNSKKIAKLKKQIEWVDND